ncbi:multiubiquitin domain-containing protein [Puniceicoccus vermicola]|uniref:Multiubiquitin domain-containing protein n=1 Tax=Puniceicoccus vermicola TaxID=388746 RepID=A0A7X1E365_9BACT|nr:multiubiquitin domain-containing protein [Puniceicoccus vermicola]MBC2601160.1 multiubiquitin domain-containing protein [Puniceicoccus vermicola]
MPNKNTSEARERPSSGYNIEVADKSLAFRPISIEDGTPTGAQLASTAGITNTNAAIVLSVLDDGSLEDISPQEVVNLDESVRKFIIVESDRTYRYVLNGQRFEWPCAVITGGQIRKLADVPSDHILYLKLRKEADREIKDHEIVDLDASGVEDFYTEHQVWLLNVQGVKVESITPTILTKDALEQAGFDTTAEWQIFLKIKGEPKMPITMDTIVDLTRRGIEKIRLTPKAVDNGSVSTELRREFDLLPGDEAYLDENHALWETVLDGRRRWILIPDYQLPEGYTVSSIVLAMDVPPTYPKAQMDMFYTNPPLALTSGRAIAATQVHEQIDGTTFSRWSRHRGPASKWNPNTDSVVTHLALVEGAILKEVEGS